MSDLLTVDVQYGTPLDGRVHVQSGMSNNAHMLALSFVVVAVVTSASPLHASPVFSHYRGVALGDSLATVVTALAADAATVKVLHERPSLIQELTWHPLRFISGLAVSADPLEKIVLTFHAGQLVRIAATYDRDRIRGLTDSDLRELVGSVYGTALLPSRAHMANPIADRAIIGDWGDQETRVVLWTEEYPRRSGLTISAHAAAARMDEAATIGASLDAAQEPLRRRALEAAAAAAIVDREALIRAQNKARFKP